MLEQPEPKFSKLRTLFWLGHYTGIDLKGDTCSQDNFTFKAKVEKRLKYRKHWSQEERSLFKLKELGKPSLKGMELNWILNIEGNLKDKHFLPKSKGHN